MMRAPWGSPGVVRPWGPGDANDTQSWTVWVKVTYIVQGVGRRVDTIGQQARDALKIKAERGLRTSHVSCGSGFNQRGPRTVSIIENFLKVSHTWLHRARPPFWGFLPGFDWEMIKTCSVGRIRKTERKPQEEVTPGRKEGPPKPAIHQLPPPA